MGENIKSNSTIVACGTAFPAAIATIRISGDMSGRLLDCCFFSTQQKQHRILRVGRLEFDGICDKATAVFFKAPQSYTGEDMAEISIHGSAALAERLIMFLIGKGARQAEAGEFTKRAFFGGKLDLSSAEGVLSLINAESDGELVAAYNDMQGGLRRQIEALQDRLEGVIAAVEVAIDFPEETGFEAGTKAGKDKAADDGMGAHLHEIEKIAAEIKTLSDGYKSGRLIREGVKIAVIGGVNVGKSSLVNALLKKERAIVTDIPGTTRDTLEDRYQHGGYKFVITDTAGLREGGDTVERLGMDRARQAAAESDIILAVCEAGGSLESQAQELLQSICGKSNDQTVSHTGGSANGKISDNQAECGIKIIYVENKTDILQPARADSIKISAKTGKNIDTLKDKILQVSGVAEGGGKVITNLRHYEALVSAHTVLCGVSAEIPAECIASDLSSAYNRLGKITGAVGSDDIINRIFSDFCVGK